MNKKDTVVSIIVPCKEVPNCFRYEAIPMFLKQTFQNFEIILLPDKFTQEKFPKTKIISTFPKILRSDKRDIGVKNAKGDIIAFIDSDAYPQRDWLEKALSVLEESNKIAAVCGPGLTPKNDNFWAQVSGWVWSSPCAAGNTSYRHWPADRREVDDYPTCNFIVKKKDFIKAGWFHFKFWSGEDTKVCHELVYKLGKKIIYDPEIVVFHHRRQTLKGHFGQIGLYGLHRGFLARYLPKTSKKIEYFLPSVLFLGFFGGLLFLLFKKVFQIFTPIFSILVYIYAISLIVYFLFLVINSLWVYAKSKNLIVSLAVFVVTFFSHLYYGLSLLKGIIVKTSKLRGQ